VVRVVCAEEEDGAGGGVGGVPELWWGVNLSRSVEYVSGDSTGGARKEGK
jgi:hypothetical protein